MLKNYLKIALRNLRRHKGYESINIVGLSIGFACFTLIAAFVQHEATYDAFHERADRIYRVNAIHAEPQEHIITAATPQPLRDVLRNDYPQLVDVTSVTTREYWIRIGNRTAKQRMHFADSSFLKMFSFPHARGRSGTLLEAPDVLIVTEDFARRYFGERDPLGQVMTVQGTYDFVVAGVLETIPSNSSLQFEVLASHRALSSLEPDYRGQWWESGYQTFVQTSDARTAGELQQQFPVLVERHVPDWLRERTQFTLQPLRQMHLDPSVRVWNSDIQAIAPLYLYVLGGIALGILLIACINFINLSTARQAQREKEIGVRKVMGASRANLYRQFIGETVLLTLGAVVVALGLAEMMLPAFNTLTGVPIRLSLRPSFLLGLLGAGLLVGVLAGSYPALLLAAQHPLESILRRRRRARYGLTTRRVLVTGQFAISIGLICCTMVIGFQVHFMQTRDLGFDPEGIIAIDMQMHLIEDGPSRIDAYLQAIVSKKVAGGLHAISRSEHVPGFFYGNTFGLAVPDRAEPPIVNVTSIDEAFLETYRIGVREGRTFSQDFGPDQNSAVLVNEAFVRMRGWDSAPGQEITFVHGEGPYHVIGVVEDFHFQSLQHVIAPQVYRYAGPAWRQQHISVRIHPDTQQRALRLLQAEWQRIIPDVPFAYEFVGDHFGTHYDAEVRTARIVGSFSAIAIVLACLGVLGLISLAVVQRTKEIGVRKVLGASVSGIVLLLTKDFARLVLVAFIVAIPVAYLVMQRWLEHFAYRIDLGPGVFLLSGALALGIALLTVSGQAIRAALANPVEALRYE